MKTEIGRDYKCQVSVNVNMAVLSNGVVSRKLNYSVRHAENPYAAGTDLPNSPSVSAVSGIMVSKGGRQWRRKETNKQRWFDWQL